MIPNVLMREILVHSGLPRNTRIPLEKELTTQRYGF